jgi:chromosome partitioning protein
MKTLLFVGKGGSGKSTTAFNVAVVAHRAGLKVGLIDADPQGSLSDMRVARAKADIPVQACRLERLSEKFALARSARLDVLIIDMPPGIGTNTLATIGFADFVLVTMRPTIFDLAVTRRWINLLRSVAQPFGVLISAAPARRQNFDAPMVRDARDALRSLGVPLWPGQITHRLIIPQSSISGRGVAEIDPAGPAAIEYAGLWRSILRATDNIRRIHHEKSSSHVA